jgi:hypothetical protein
VFWLPVFWLPVLGLPVPGSPVLGWPAFVLLWPDVACEPVVPLVWLVALACWPDDPTLLLVLSA